MKRLLAVFILCGPAVLFGQTGTIRGMIVSEHCHEPLIGANVFIVGTQKGAATDMEGHFMLKALQPGSYQLTITYIGFDSQVLTVNLKADTCVVLHITMSDRNFIERMKNGKHFEGLIAKQAMNTRPCWVERIFPDDPVMRQFGIRDADFECP